MQDDVESTKKGIRRLRLMGGKTLIGMLLNFGKTALKFALTVVGGLILITLTRMALKKWSDTYMPKSSSSSGGISIFGIRIPGLQQVINLGLGIYNFFRVGVMNGIDRLKVFFKGVTNSLFGRKGPFKDLATTMNSLKRIVLAWIIGNTKKVGGGAVKWIMIGLSYILDIFLPGSGVVLRFLSKLAPLIYAYIANKIAGAWADAKTNSEKRFNDHMKVAKGISADFVKKLTLEIRNAGQGVISFAPPAAIPGLVSPKAGPGQRPPKGAIMRSTRLHYNMNSSQNSDLQKTQLEELNAQNEEADKKRWGKRDGSILSRLETGRRLAGEMVRKNGWQSLGGKNPLMPIINGELEAIDNYISQLQKSQRFKNVSGPLYDPIRGWNPGYRVLQSDLMSAIPLTPFEQIHSKMDVVLGEPAEPEYDSIGYMPFAWVQNGVKFSAHPINFEIQRARNIRKIWEDLAFDLINGAGWTSNIFDAKRVRETVFPKFAKRWREQALISQMDYGFFKVDDIWFKDKFVQFINKFRRGEIDHDQNDLEHAQRGMTSKFANAVGEGAVAGADWAVGRHVGNVSRVLQYDTREA